MSSYSKSQRGANGTYTFLNAVTFELQIEPKKRICFGTYPSFENAVLRYVYCVGAL